MAQWMMPSRLQNPLYTHFEDLCDICISTTDLEPGRRPAPRVPGRCFRRGQFAELDTLGDLTRRAWAKNNQVIGRRAGTCRWIRFP